MSTVMNQPGGYQNNSLVFIDTVITKIQTMWPADSTQKSLNGTCVSPAGLKGRKIDQSR